MRRALGALLFAALVACTGCATLRVSTPATAPRGGASAIAAG